MNKRQMIAALFEATGIKISEDDPAFLLVELNRLMLDGEVRKAAKELEDVTDKFRDVTIKNVDDFVSVANETLVRFNDKTKELQVAISSIQLDKEKQETIKFEKSNPRKIDPFSFILGAIVLAVGCLCGLLIR